MIISFLFEKEFFFFNLLHWKLKLHPVVTVYNYNMSFNIDCRFLAAELKYRFTHFFVCRLSSFYWTFISFSRSVQWLQSADAEHEVLGGVFFYEIPSWYTDMKNKSRCILKGVLQMAEYGTVVCYRVTDYR